MKKNITTTAPDNEVTGLKQQKKLIGVSYNPVTGFLGMQYKIEQLDARGTPLAIQGGDKEDSIVFHSAPISSLGGTFETEIPEDITEAMAQIAELVEPLFIKYGGLREEEKGDS